jgi:2-polyprenyl-3-methyl-5-hydroxy-6-metoxy-1,4-benzoquinol methylase
MKDRIACTFCESSHLRKSRFRRPVKWDGTVFNFLYCKTCRAFSLYPLLSENQLKKLYSEDYAKRNTPSEASYAEFFFNHGFEHSLKILKDALNSNTRICDFGCGTDDTIANLAEKIGAKYYGVEYEQSVVMSLTRDKPKNKYFTLEEFIKNDNSFDIIFIGDVLEHVPSPNKLLQIIAQKIEPHGKIVIQGPLENAPGTLNMLVKIKSLFMQRKEVLHHPYHVSLASRKSMHELFQRNGLQIMKFKTYEVMWPLNSKLIERKSRFLNPMYLAKFLDFKAQRFFPLAGNRFLAVLKSRNLNT